MGKVLKCDVSAGPAWVQAAFTTSLEVWVQFRCLINAAAVTEWTGSTMAGANFGQLVTLMQDPGTRDAVFLTDKDTADGTWVGNNPGGSEEGLTPDADSEWHTFKLHNDGSGLSEFFIDGDTVWSTTADDTGPFDSFTLGPSVLEPDPTAGGIVYYDDVRVGTTEGDDDLFSDDFEDGTLDAWDTTTGDVSVVEDPEIPSFSPGRRVGVAFNDGPLEPDPTWTWLDDDSVFPAQFVAGYDTENGRQSLTSQTETGTATVYVNDHEQGLFDDRNTGSPYFGLLSGRQIILQLWDPVTQEWEPQFRGIIDSYSYDIDGSAVNADGDPINASIQLECVDVFDYLNGYGLTPGLDGVVPPAGMEDGVYYAETSGLVWDRVIEILTDAGVDSDRWVVASGNVRVIAVKYDPDESALTALRDAADAEFPFVSNIYVDRYGRFVFRGRYSRFNPDDVQAQHEEGDPQRWDFNRWKVGDGKAIQADNERAQMRVLSFERSRQNIINAAMCWPQGLPAEDMGDQIFVSLGSIDAFGKHQAPPLSDLLTLKPGDDAAETAALTAQECYKYAKLLVKNQASPREAITALQVKALRVDDYRAEATWAVLTRADIGHIVNVAVGYPGGTGFTGDSPEDDYYIEGRSLRVRPLNSDHDYVELDLNVSPAVWSMDTHNVFPPYDSDPEAPPLHAAFRISTEDEGFFTFTDTSTEGPSGPITGWAWDFGDGSGTSTDQNPDYTYTANGTYEVTLTVTGTGGDGTDDETRVVRVIEVP